MKVFSLCIMLHILLKQRTLIIDLFTYISYYTASPLRAENETFIVFPPETSTVSGTNIMAKYIFVDDWPVIALWLQ